MRGDSPIIAELHAAVTSIIGTPICQHCAVVECWGQYAEANLFNNSRKEKWGQNYVVGSD